MERQIITKTLNVDGMTCPSCEISIENALKSLPGVMEVRAKYAVGIIQLTYDSGQVELSEIIKAIERLDYKVYNRRQGDKTEFVKNSGEALNITGLLRIGIVLFALYFLIQNTIGFNFIPEVNQGMSYGILFIVGLLTSLHCIAMCGGINLSQCAGYKIDSQNKLSKLKPSFLYNSGRLISYTVIGGMVGAIGSVISLSGAAKGLAAIIAGIFMIIMGLNMLNIFPRLRSLSPRMPRLILNKLYASNGKGPFYIGLLNGFMPCGPLQSMQIYALGTGSFILGAFSMFLFSLGTIPLMFAFGAASTLLSGKFTHKILNISAVLVMVLGIIMLNRGLSLSGIDSLSVFSPASFINSNADNKSYENAASIADGVQYVTTKFTGRSYAPITVQMGIPVKWTIQIEQGDLNRCNNPIQIPKYGIEVNLKPGDNLVEFTPGESGIIPYSCWMGMIRSRIIVVDDLNTFQETVNYDTDSSYNSDTGCCGGGHHDNCTESLIDNKILTDDILIADNTQEITVTINNGKFSPGIIVLQKGADFIIRFNVEEALDKAGQYGNIIYFPEYQGGIDLSEYSETPLLPATGDFSFQDATGSKRVFVKVVEDIGNIDKGAIIKDAQSYTISSGCGTASCH